MRHLFLIFILCIASSVAHAKRQVTHSIWLYNETADQLIVNTNASTTRPIASLTKLMTAMVALDYGQGLKTEYRLSNKVGSKLPSKKYTKEELLTAMLVRSDNAAAETMSENYPGGRKEFIKAMNTKARLFGMERTMFVDPTGLGMGNQSTAGDVFIMISRASAYGFIRSTSIKKQAIFETVHKKRVRSVVLENTNKKLLFEFDNIIVSKTGFTNPAGFCLGLAVEKNKQKYIVVILGAKNPSERSDIAKELLYNHLIDSDIKPEYEDIKYDQII